jgi:hypothetical protein
LSSEESERCGLADLLIRTALELRVDMYTGSSEPEGTAFDLGIILPFLEPFSFDFSFDFY